MRKQLEQVNNYLLLRLRPIMFSRISICPMFYSEENSESNDGSTLRGGVGKGVHVSGVWKYFVENTNVLS